MKNVSFAKRILEWLAQAGVQDVCVCAGRRNAAFIALLERQKGFRIHPFFEERSAAFFALGCSKRTRRPSAIFTTSGTACAELLPAFVEAWYAGLPLIAVTSDRPKHLRNSGAPQTIDQLGILGKYVEHCLDLDPASEPQLPAPPLGRSVQLNVCFAEPILDEPVPALQLTPSDTRAPRQPAHSALQDKLSSWLASLKHPLVVLGPMSSEDSAAVASFLARAKLPVYAESTSGMRGSPELATCELKSGNTAIGEMLKSGTFDAVLRIGAVPAARLWRDLDEKMRSIPVLSISNQNFDGLGRGELLTVPLNNFSNIAAIDSNPRSYNDVFERDAAFSEKLETLLLAEPSSEPGQISRLSLQIPETAALYLGNSLPIREWDLAATRQRHWASVEANRGANGIDGQLSTFLGWSAAASDRWCVLGDLTTLYDLSAPYSISAGGRTRIVVVNNFGGQIFRPMFSEKLFRNEHRLHFEHWARMWGLDYCCVEADQEFPTQLPDRVVIELLPDTAATERFWSAHARLSLRP